MLQIILPSTNLAQRRNQWMLILSFLHVNIQTHLDDRRGLHTLWHLQTESNNYCSFNTSDTCMLGLCDMTIYLSCEEISMSQITLFTAIFVVIGTTFFHAARTQAGNLHWQWTWQKDANHPGQNQRSTKERSYFCLGLGWKSLTWTRKPADFRPLFILFATTIEKCCLLSLYNFINEYFTFYYMLYWKLNWKGST